MTPASRCQRAARDMTAGEVIAAIPGGRAFRALARRRGGQIGRAYIMCPRRLHEHSLRPHALADVRRHRGRRRNDPRCL